MTIGERIKKARIEKGYTQERLGDLVGLKKAAINKYETGLVVNIKASVIKKLADALDVDPVWLIGIDEDIYNTKLPEGVVPVANLQRHKVRVFGSMAAGTPICDEEFPDVVVDGPLDADFALRVKGDSMEPEFKDGDLVFIKTMPEIPHNGIICVIAIDNDAALKRVYRNEDSVTLISTNPAYEPMTYKFSSGRSIRILGIPVGFLRMYKRK